MRECVKDNVMYMNMHMPTYGAAEILSIKDHKGSRLYALVIIAATVLACTTLSALFTQLPLVSKVCIPDRMRQTSSVKPLRNP